MGEEISLWSWGRLKDHKQTCPDCDGTGNADEDEDEGCSICDGEGDVRWPSFYADDTATCDDCGEEKRVACELFEGCIQDVCLTCLLKMHDKECHCGLWPTAEAFTVGS